MASANPSRRFSVITCGLERSLIFARGGTSRERKIVGSCGVSWKRKILGWSFDPNVSNSRPACRDKDPAKKKLILQEAVEHILFISEVYKWQSDIGKQLVHEQRTKSVAWNWSSMKKVMALPEVGEVTCSNKHLKGGRRVEPIKLVSNSPCVVQEVGRACYGLDVSPPTGGIQSDKFVHPEELSHAILKGIRREVQTYGFVNNMEVGRRFDESELPVNWEFIKKDDAQFYDEYTGIQLDTDATHAAMQEELKYMDCLLYTSPSPRDGLLSRMPSSA